MNAKGLLAFVVTASVLSACRCDEAKDPAQEPEQEQEHEQEGQPSVTVTSHVDGQVITGSRSLTLSGTADDVSSVSLTQNGNGVEVARDGSAFSASIQLGNNTNTFVVTATHENGKVATATLALRFPYSTFTNYQPADVIIGHANATSGDAVNPPTAGSISVPYGAVAFGEGTFYVPEAGNHRVLGFNGLPTGIGAQANFVLGQEGFDTSASGTSATAFRGPQAVLIADGKLFLVDFSNSRVLIWNTVPKTTGVPADVVVGKPDLNSGVATCTASGLGSPEDIAVVDGKLIVVDGSNNRVLVWNTVPTTNGAPADFVLGQSDFTHCENDDANQDNVPDATPSAQTFNYASGVWTDGKRLAVVDNGNRRVLIWNTFPTDSLAPADIVLGQPDFQTGEAAAGATGLRFPTLIEGNGNQLFLSDSGNNRVLIWNTFPASTQQPADVVLGHSNFTHTLHRDDDENGVEDGPTARTLNAPGGVRLIDGALWVSSQLDHRVMRFPSAP